MKSTLYLSLIFLIQLSSCKNHVNHAHNSVPATKGSVEIVNMRTGFYYVAETQDGIKMRKENSDEFYSIEKSPFVSVDNIIKTELHKENFKDGPITSLYMKFDEKGTKDLEDGTGNPLHPKIAVIIANKLLYVVDNSTNIKTGEMIIILNGFPEQEIESMKKSVEDKK